MVKRIRVINETKGQSKLLPPNTTTYGADMGDGSYSFELVSDVQGPFPVSGVDPAPLNITPPSAVGEATEGKVVSGVPGVWEGASAVTAQWMDGGDAFGPAGYDVTGTRAIGGKSLRLRETATNAKGPTVVYSEPVGPFTTAPQFDTMPVLSGSPTAGGSMTATAGVASGYPAPQMNATIQRQLGTSGEWLSAVGMAAVFAPGYRYRVASAASNSVQTVEVFSAPTAVVAATAAPLAAGANIPKQTILTNSGTFTVSADVLFTGKVDTYSLVGAPAAFTINATTGLVSINTTGLALRTDETITVRASNSTPATLDRTFSLEVVNQSGTPTIPGAVFLGTVTIAPGANPGEIVVTNHKLPANGGSPLLTMRMRANLADGTQRPLDYPATLGNHTIGGLFGGPARFTVYGINAVGEGRPYSSIIEATVPDQKRPPVGFSYAVEPSPAVQGKDGILTVTASGKTPMTFTVIVDGQTLTNETGQFDVSSLTAGTKIFTGTITNADGTLNISGGFSVAAYVAPTVSLSISPAAPKPGDTVTVTVTKSAGILDLGYVKGTDPEVELKTAPYTFVAGEGRHTIAASVTDGYDEVATASVTFNSLNGAELFEDSFDGAAGTQLASLPGWTLALGNPATFALKGNGQLLQTGSGGNNLILMPALAFDNQRIEIQLVRPPSGGGAQGATLFGYQDNNNFCRLVVNNGNISVGRVINGASMVTIADYGSIMSGTPSVTVGSLIIDYNKNKFQLIYNGTKRDPISGSEVFATPLTGFRAGLWTYGTVVRDPFANAIKYQESTVFAPVVPVDPTEPEPEVPDPELPQPSVDNITHDPANVYRMTAPITGSMRVRPYGATTGGTVTTGTGSVVGFLPGDGVFHVALDTGSGYGQPISVWAHKVNGGGQWYGRNCKSVTVAPMSGGSQIVPVPEDGKLGVMMEPEPKVQISGGQYLNGIMKNKTVTTGQGLPGQAFDSRELLAGGVVRTVEGWRLADLHTNWPDTFKKGDVYAKVISIPTANLGTSGQESFRSGIVSHLMAATIEDRAPAVKEMAGQVFKGPAFKQGYVSLSGYDALLSKIQAMQYPCSCPVSHVEYIYDKIINEPTWQYGIARGGQFWKDSHEPINPRKHTYPSINSNYYMHQLNEAAALLLMSNLWTNAQKKNVLDALIYFGRHADTPGMSARMSAGMGQVQELPVALFRLACGRRFEDMTLPNNEGGQRGHRFGSFFKWTADMLPMLDKHTRNDWPGFSREREIVQIVSVSDTKTVLDLAYYMNPAGFADSDRKQRFIGLEVLRANGQGGALMYGGDDPSNIYVTTVNGKPTIRRWVAGRWDGLQAGEKVYMRVPAAKRPFVGMADWMYTAEERLDRASWAGYIPTPSAQYRSQACPYGFAALLHVLGEIPKSSPYRPVVEYCIRTSYTNAANNGWLNEYPGPHFVGESTWVSNFYNANKAAWNMEMADL